MHGSAIHYVSGTKRRQYVSEPVGALDGSSNKYHNLNLVILYLSQTKQIDTISSCVLDSPYSSLWNVVREFGKTKTKIPEFILEHIMEYIRQNIKKNHQFDIRELDLLKRISKI